VHGEGDVHGLVPRLIGIACAKGVSAYIGDGANRWPAVHRLDAPHLFCLALKRAPAGTRLHAIDEEGVRARDAAEVIGRHLHAPVVSVPAENALEHFGFLAAIFGLDGLTSSARTRQLLGWKPTQPGFIADLEQGHYFADVPGHSRAPAGAAW
jgi:nucleoside-diphosphate-sugar epimerase